ncbi:MAG: hypothetical protein N2445_06655, partial [Acidobacteria bacterium]|nr:hypothetical protein [Acidobacteriota bacterium]
FLGAGLAAYLDKNFLQWPKKLNIFAIFVMFLVGICLIQLIPLPVSFWNFIDKERVQMYEDGAKAEELLQSEKYRIDPFEKTEFPYESERYTPKLPSFLTLTRTPIATIRALIALLSFFCFILLLEDVVRQGNSELKKLALFVGLIGLTIGIIALIEKGIEHRTHILWIRESSRAQTAFGPFVNANHGEAFINLTFPIIYYLIWRKSARTRKIMDKIGMMIFILAILVLQGALVASGSSRGNFLYLALLPSFFLLQLGLKKKRVFILGSAISYFIIIGVVCLFAIQSGLITDAVRIRMNPNIFLEFSVFGNGVGSFEEVFPAKIVDWPIFFKMRNTYLENEYLQSYFEIGIIGLLSSIFFALFMIWKGVVFLKNYGKGFWLSAAFIVELIRVWFDMTFHIIPLVAVFILVFAILEGKTTK